jgi:polysaccharide export outer membrane protein
VAHDTETTARDAAPVLEALMNIGQHTLVPVTGSSMRPTLLPGDAVEVGPFHGLPRPGQIVLARVASGLVVHRLVRVDMVDGRRSYRLRGDAGRALDAGLPRQCLLGRVRAFVRQGRRLEVDDRPLALRRQLLGLALYRRRGRLLRAAGVLLVSALWVLGWTAAQEGIAPAPDYRFGPGDSLSLRIWDGQKIGEHKLTVQSDGEAFLPITGIGSMTVSGLTVSDLKKTLEDRLHMIFKDARIELLVIKYASHPVHLMGEVRSTTRVDSGPGQWPLRGASRVVEFLAEHGGASEDADLMHILIAKPSGARREVNLYRAVFHGSMDDNPVLESGDFVFVPTMGMRNSRVFVLGEVRQPGAIPIMDRLGLVEAISRASGFTQWGYQKGVVVLRRGSDGQTEMRLADFKKMHKEGDLSADIPLQPGDVIYVPRRAILTVQEVFSIINPSLQALESIYILDSFQNNNN